MKLIPIDGRGNEYLFTPEGQHVVWTSRSKKGFKRLQRSLRTSNTIEAREKRDELFAVWFGEKKKENKKVLKLAGERWDEWAKTKSRKSQGTNDSIKYSGQHIRPLIESMDPNEITGTWWENTYIPTKRAEASDRKFFNEWKWLSSFLNSLHREGHIEKLPLLENPDGETEEGLNLEDSEINALYAQAHGDLTLQIDLGFKHFMRRSEVLLLPYAEINFRKGGIELPAFRTKIRKARFVPLNDETLATLRARKALSKSPYVFPNRKDPKRPMGRKGNDKAWKGAIRRANQNGITISPEATFHDLRHSGLSRAFVATNRYAEICVVAGLSLAEAQRTYLHLTPDQTRFVAGLVSLKNQLVVTNGKQ